jgi:ABC-type nitrate/sulfonate/bicarbonate transport system substrate-binding protein
MIQRTERSSIEKRLTRTIVAAAIVCLIVLGVWFVSSRLRDSRVVHLAGVKSAFYLPLMVAHDRNMFERFGLRSELDLFDDNVSMLNALIRKDADVSALGSGGAFPLEAASGGQFRFVYGQNSASYSLLVPPGSSIRSLDDLRGKKIGTWKSPTPRAFLHLVLDGRIGGAEFQIETIDFNYLNTYLRKGSVDALFNTDVYTEQAIRSGDARYLYQNPMEELVLKPFFNGGGLIRRDLEEREPEKYRAVISVMTEAVTFIQEHERDARLTLLKHLPKLSEEVALSAPMDRFVQLSAVDLPAAQKVADLLNSLPPDSATGKKLLPSKVDVSRMFK